MTLLFLPHNQSVPKGELQGRRCCDTQNVTPWSPGICWAAVQSHTALPQFHLGGVSQFIASSCRAFGHTCPVTRCDGWVHGQAYPSATPKSLFTVAVSRGGVLALRKPPTATSRAVSPVYSGSVGVF